MANVVASHAARAVADERERASATEKCAESESTESSRRTHSAAPTPMEVDTDDSEGYDSDPPVAQPVRPPPPQPPAPDRGGWEKLYDPDEAQVEEERLEAEAAKPFLFYVRGLPFAKLSKVTLPRSWATADVGKLTGLLAKRAGYDEWDCHLEGPRGAIPSALAVRAAIVRRERCELRAGPPPSDTVGSRNRRSLWVWGRCVDGSCLRSPKRQPGFGAHQVARVCLGDEHVLALTDVGLVLSWGRNDSGQLGTGDEAPRGSPRVVRALAVASCVEVACGPRCSGAIERDGRLWTFGANQPANRPTRLHSSWANAHGATPCGLDTARVAFGLTHALLLTRGGELWSWGYNESFQLGWAEAVTSMVLRVGFQKPRAPLPLGGAVPLSGGAVAPSQGVPAFIACGEAHSACATSCGELYAWGDNSTGQCGSYGGGVGAMVPTPVPIPMPQGDAVVARVHCFGSTTVVVTATGRCYTLGGGGRMKVGGEGEEGEEEAEGEDAEAEEEARVVELDVDAPQAAGDGRGGEGGGGGEGGEGGEGGGGAGGEQADLRQGLSRGLGRLLGTRRLLADGVAEAAGCEDHALLLDVSGGCRGLGYNRYHQANPGVGDLRIGTPTPLPTTLFGHQRLLALAAGGGCSAAVTETRETLAACCAAVVKSRLELVDTALCVDLLCLASRCETPALAPLASAAAACVGKARALVGSRLGALGIDVDEALAALHEMRAAGGPMDGEHGVDV